MKRKHTKLLSMLLSAAMFVTSIFYVSEKPSAAEIMLYQDEMQLNQEGAYSSTEVASFAHELITESQDSMSVQEDTAQQTIYDGLYNMASEINISSYQLTPEQVKTIVTNIVNSSPELFYVNGGYRYYTNGSTITRILPTYTMTADELSVARPVYNQKINEILAGVDNSWSNVQKILYVHDYLAQHFAYDTTYTIYDAYQFLTKGTGVCQSYTLVFLALMNELGIQSTTTVSEAMNHTWNLVNLQGSWYHIDVTWDDPVPDYPGLARHSYLLLSDSAIGSTRGNSQQTHYSWTTSYTCTDTTYDNYFWYGSNSPFQCVNNTWYYSAFDSTDKNGYLYSYSFTTNQSSTVYTLGKWHTSSNGYYLGAYSGLSLYKNLLYFNTEDTLYCYNPALGTAEDAFTQIYKPSTSGKIYGSYTEKNILTYAMADTPSGTKTLYTYTVASEEPEETPSPSPAVSAAPASATPAASSSPAASVTPASAAPAASSSPAASVTPTSAAPAASSSPAASVTPASTAPAASSSPSASVTPASATPAATSSPAASVTPASQSPAVSSSPSASVTPTSAAPVVSSSPSSSVTPTSAAPAVSGSPAASVAPTSSAPASQTPVVSDTPTTLPTESATSPDVSGQPDTSATPDNPSPSPDSKLRGDIDTDGNVSLADAQTALKAALKIISLDTTQAAAADVDNDTTVTLADAQLILKLALRIIQPDAITKTQAGEPYIILHYTGFLFSRLPFIRSR